jgi:hypothetical protein
MGGELGIKVWEPLPWPNNWNTARPQVMKRQPPDMASWINNRGQPTLGGPAVLRLGCG